MSRELLIQLLHIEQIREYINERWINIVVATQIRGLRKKRGWSQVQLAEAAGIATLTIIRLEKLYWPKRMNPSIQTLRKIAAALDVVLVARFEEWGTLVDEICTDISIPKTYHEEFGR